MKHSVYVIIALMALTMLWTTSGCSNKSGQGEDSLSDSTLIDTLETDTLESLIEETPMPKAADELFDDFIFNFAANKKLQMERTDFPLQVDRYGQMATLEKRHWKMEHFFMRQGFYTLVAGNMKDIDGSKDTKLEHVTIEKVLLQKRSIEQYIFNRVDGLWKLQQLKFQKMADNQNGGFYEFYDRFVNDSTFRMNSLAESVDFSGPDPEDDFGRMEGSIMPEQWSMFAPELPKVMIYNISYGNKPIKGNQRILIIRGIANGLETELTFKKTKTGYMLVKLNT